MGIEKRDERRYEWKRGVLKGRKGTTKGMTGKYRDGMGERVLKKKRVGLGGNGTIEEIMENTRKGWKKGVYRFE